MKNAILIVAVVALLAGVAAAQARSMAAREFKELNRVPRGFYIVGFVEGFLGGIVLGAGAPGTAMGVAVCVDNMTYGQAEAIINAFVSAHPEAWDKPVAPMATGALTRACGAR